MRSTLLFTLLLFGCPSNSNNPDMAMDFSVADLSLPQATTLAPAQTLTTCLAADATSIYWVEANGAVMKVPTAGGAATQVATGADKSSCVVADGSGVYYAATTGGFATLHRSGTVIATGQHPLPEGKGFYAVHGGFLYFVTDVYGPADAAFSGKNAIVRVPTGGGAIEIVYTEVMGDPGGLAVDAANFYYSDMNGTFAAPRAGGAPVSLGTSVIKRNAFTVSPMHIAIAEVAAIGMGNVAVMRLDGMQRTVLLDRLITPLAVDDKGVYVSLDGHVTRLALDGKSQLILASAQARAAVTDATSLYFTDGAAILKVGR
jgi:hypothetical protein